MQVNDYVRTKDGLIHKITDNFNTTKRIATDNSKYVYEYNEIIKSSPNIIDLIEENDYIKLNGRGNIKYWRIVKGPTNELMIEDDGWNELDDFEDEEIDGVITHEQMERCEYKI